MPRRSSPKGSLKTPSPSRSDPMSIDSGKKSSSSSTTKPKSPAAAKRRSPPPPTPPRVEDLIGQNFDRMPYEVQQLIMGHYQYGSDKYDYVTDLTRATFPLLWNLLYTSIPVLKDYVDVSLLEEDSYIYDYTHPLQVMRSLRNYSFLQEDGYIYDHTKSNVFSECSLFKTQADAYEVVNQIKTDLILYSGGDDGNILVPPLDPNNPNSREVNDRFTFVSRNIFKSVFIGSGNRSLLGYLYNQLRTLLEEPNQLKGAPSKRKTKDTDTFFRQLNTKMYNNENHALNITLLEFASYEKYNETTLPVFRGLTTELPGSRHNIRIKFHRNYENNRVMENQYILSFECSVVNHTHSNMMLTFTLKTPLLRSGDQYTIHQDATFAIIESNSMNRSFSTILMHRIHMREISMQNTDMVSMHTAQIVSNLQTMHTQQNHHRQYDSDYDYEDDDSMTR